MVYSSSVQYLYFYLKILIDNINSLRRVMDQRVFYSLLERVGGNGKYQTVALRVWSILMMIMSSTCFFLPFMFYQG